MAMAFWEHICRSLLGEVEKVDSEGKWKEAHILLGFELNVERFPICLPDAKRSDDWETANEPMFNPGHRVIAAKKIQLR